MPNKLSGFDAAVSDRIHAFLKRSSSISAKKIAVFDADGTLWRGDVGEDYFRYQIKNRSLASAPHSKDLWADYWNAVQSGRAVEAYTWLAIWNAGRQEKDVLDETEKFFKNEFSKQTFKPMQTLLALFEEHGFENWIVSASFRLMVVSGAKIAFNIPAERVVGMAVKIKNGILQKEVDGVLPYREGKVKEIQRRIGHTPLFAAGNTYWDQEMLSLCPAEGLALAIYSEHKDEPNFESEQKLKTLAQEKNWLTQGF